MDDIVYSREHDIPKEPSHTKPTRPDFPSNRLRQHSSACPRFYVSVFSSMSSLSSYSSFHRSC